MLVWYRLAAYVVGFLSALMLAGLMFRSGIRPLSLAMGATLVVWAFDCLVMIFMLWFDFFVLEVAPARDALMTLNATLLALCPTVVLVLCRRGHIWK